jgi:hypothetical protein
LGFLGFLALHIFPIVYILGARKSEDPLTKFWVWSSFIVALQLLLNGLVDNVFSLKPLMYIYWTVTTIAMWKTKEYKESLALRSGVPEPTPNMPTRDAKDEPLDEPLDEPQDEPQDEPLDEPEKG